MLLRIFRKFIFGMILLTFIRDVRPVVGDRRGGHRPLDEPRVHNVSTLLLHRHSLVHYPRGNASELPAFPFPYTSSRRYWIAAGGGMVLLLLLCVYIFFLCVAVHLPEGT